jgi:hypothetical protein
MSCNSSRCRIARRWFATVFTLIESSPAISFEDRPRATSCTICRCRGESSASDGGDFRLLAMIALVTEQKYVPRCETRRMPSRSSRSGVPLVTKPFAPSRTASSTSAGRS